MLRDPGPQKSLPTQLQAHFQGPRGLSLPAGESGPKVWPRSACLQEIGELGHVAGGGGGAEISTQSLQE